MKNIAFVGLSGCGKSVVSKRVAAIIQKPWFDSDLEIEAEAKMSVARLFAEKGEAYFRERETLCVRRLSECSGAVIAYGGGAVLNNAELIRRNATVIYLFRSIPDIVSTLESGTRPLLKNPEALFELYEQRRGIYESICDKIIKNDGSVEDAARKVLEAINETAYSQRA